MLGKGHHDATGKLLDLEIDLGVILQRLADADEAAAVFFDGIDEVEAFGDEFVAQAGAVVVNLDVGYAESTVEGIRASVADARVAVQSGANARS